MFCSARPLYFLPSDQQQASTASFFLCDTFIRILHYSKEYTTVAVNVKLKRSLKVIQILGLASPKNKCFVTAKNKPCSRLAFPFFDIDILNLVRLMRHLDTFRII